MSWLASMKHDAHKMATARWLAMASAAALFLLAPATALAGSTSPKEIVVWEMVMTLFGGLALFLFGMEQMSDALKAAAGERMKMILAKLTSNRFMGAVTGAIVTAVIQSSSVTTVLVVGFVSAGLMSLSQSIGVIMGANIGTTITAQIVAFKVTKYSLLMVAVGFAMLFTGKREKMKQYGAMIMGLGLVFFGMAVMSDAMKPLRTYQPFLDIMVQMGNPLYGILVAAVFTGIIQSSSATTAVVIVLASQGFITLEAGIALAFGANIGTCVTAMLASIGKPREAVRAAVVHVMFNVIGVLLWIGLIDQLAHWVRLVSPSHPELEGIERLAAETPRQIANAHTFFNISNTLVCIGFVSYFARAVERIVPDEPIEDKVIAKGRYLDSDLIETPSLALNLARMEISGMAARVSGMLERIVEAFLTGDRETIREIAALDDEVDVLHQEILMYLGEVSKRPLSESQGRELLRLMSAADRFESMGDVIETDLADLGERRIDSGVQVSDATAEVLKGLHAAVLDAVELSVRAIKLDSQKAAQQVVAAEVEIQRLLDHAARHQAERLVADEPNRLPLYTIETEAIDRLRRVYFLAKRVARGDLPAGLKRASVYP